MTIRARHLLTLVAVLVTAVILVPTGSSTPTISRTTSPTLYFIYSMNCTFTVQNDLGNVVSTIPPGAYQVDVRTPVAFGTVPLQVEGITDMTACKGFPQFQLTGPGINFSTTMTAGCVSDLTFGATFQPSSTYVAQDNNQPSVTRTTITTLASGSPPPAPQGATLPSTGTSSTDIVGSGLKQSASVLGTLTGTLSAAGTPTLTIGGKPVSTLKAGRYTFVITDKDAKGSFTLKAPKLGTTAALTGAAKFVGKRTTTLKLAAGRWTYSTGVGKIHAFVVTG